MGFVGDAVKWAGSKIAGGGPTGDEVRDQQAKLYTPTQSNYGISGLSDYQNALNQNTGNSMGLMASTMGQYNNAYQNADRATMQNATGLIGQTAQGNGPSLARANLQAGLNNTFRQLQSTALSDQGNQGTGLSQRNLLNAQAAAANQVQQNAATAAVAEQLGAQGQYASAANALAGQGTQNAALASQAGLAMRGQNAGLLNAQSQNATNAFNANVQQTNANMAYDAAMSGRGRDAANLGLQGAQADSNSSSAGFKFLGNVGAGVAAAMSDENNKTDIAGGKTDVASVLKSLSGDITSPAAAGSLGLLGSNDGIKPMGGYIAPSGGSKSAGGGGGFDLSSLKGLLGGGGANASAVAAPSIAGMAGGAGYAMPTAAMGAGGAAGAAGAAGGAGSLASLASLAAMASDERNKTDISRGGGNNGHLHAFMQELDPATFRYKDEARYGAGPRVGIMAQDAEKSPVGAGMVLNTPEGKMIDIPKAVGTSLASLAYLNDRMDKLERKKLERKKNPRGA